MNKIFIFNTGISNLLSVRFAFEKFKGLRPTRQPKNTKSMKTYKNITNVFSQEHVILEGLAQN